MLSLSYTRRMRLCRKARSQKLLGISRARLDNETLMRFQLTLIILLAHKERISTLGILPMSRQTATHDIRGRTQCPTAIELLDVELLIGTSGVGNQVNRLGGAGSLCSCNVALVNFSFASTVPVIGLNGLGGWLGGVVVSGSRRLIDHCWRGLGGEVS